MGIPVRWKRTLQGIYEKYEEDWKLSSVDDKAMKAYVLAAMANSNNKGGANGQAWRSKRKSIDNLARLVKTKASFAQLAQGKLDIPKTPVLWAIKTISPFP
jgi:hypothetical protein